ncbi:MAG TPA: DUF4440 domain-containing protein [Gemmatimonadaceae bacterium]|jgi:ketosteroid isomerase-like protein|nr:DUF4440 domain-containing protein [Gemmatimonadaceae bacterium]
MQTPLREMTLALATLALTACNPSSPSSSAAPEFTAADEAALRAVFDSTESRVHAKNWPAWAGQFAEDAVFHPSNGKALNGRAAIQAWGEAFPPLEQFDISDAKVTGDGNLAYGSSVIARKIQGARVGTAKQLVVFRRSATGKWEVAGVSVTSDLPMLAPAVAKK